MQAHQGDHYPSAPPPRPPRATSAMPSERATRPRPRIISISYWTWLGACLVGVATAAATLRYFGELQAAISSIVARQFPRETPATRDLVATVAVATLIGAGVLIVLVQMTLAIAMHSGRRWARVTLALFTLLSALYSVALFGTAPMITKVGLLTTTTLMVIAAVPMFLPAGKKWFDQQRFAQPGSYDYNE